MRSRFSATDGRRRTLDAIIGGPEAGSPDNSVGVLVVRDFHEPLVSRRHVAGRYRALVESAGFTAPTPDEAQERSRWIDAGLPYAAATSSERIRWQGQAMPPSYGVSYRRASIARLTNAGQAMPFYYMIECRPNAWLCSIAVAFDDFFDFRRRRGRQ